MRIFAFAFIILLASCSSTRRSSHSTSVDLTNVVKTDSGSISRLDSSATKTDEISSNSSRDSAGIKSETEENSESINVVLFVDTTHGVHMDTGKPANDYDGAEKVFDVTVNGHQIRSSQPISNIIVESKHGRQVFDASQVKTIDSGSRRSAEATQLTKIDSSHDRSTDSLSIKTKTKESKLKRSGPAWGFWIPVILIAIVVVFLQIRFGLFTGLIKWFLALFKRRKDPGDNSPLKNMTYPDPPQSNKTG